MLANKVALVTGVANKNSIAWGVAKAWSEAGARVILTVSDERFREKVDHAIAKEWNSKGKPLVFCCDVQKPGQVEHLFEQVGGTFDGKLDAMLHSIAYAPREAIRAPSILDIQNKDFEETITISSYSLVSLTKAAFPLLQAAENGSSVTSLTFDASERFIPNYAAMAPAKAALETISRYLAGELGPSNVRVNCLSAGPINTLAARGIPNFRSMLKHHAGQSPLRRNVTVEEVANTATFLASDMASGITGQTVHVDAGYSIT